jgi:hypothetical protein
MSYFYFIDQICKQQKSAVSPEYFTHLMSDQTNKLCIAIILPHAKEERFLKLNPI